MQMNEARIAELLAPFIGSVSDSKDPSSPDASEAAVLSRNQLRNISMYIDILLRWNARVNLTAVRDPEEIVTRHFGESLFAARHLFPQPGVATDELGVIDVGSGAGFPGLPIKIWAPQVHLTLIESNQKKATFLREVVRKLVLAGVEVFAGRADAYEKAKSDVVTLRAVERFESIIPIVNGLVAPAGRLAILAGEAQLELVLGLLPGVKWDEPMRLPLSRSRVLIVGVKNQGR
jgi:16S rRNA (guanine527-N7)-methyltransferase